MFNEAWRRRTLFYLLTDARLAISFFCQIPGIPTLTCWSSLRIEFSPLSFSPTQSGLPTYCLIKMPKVGSKNEMPNTTYVQPLKDAKYFMKLSKSWCQLPLNNARFVEVCIRNANLATLQGWILRSHARNGRHFVTSWSARTIFMSWRTKEENGIGARRTDVCM